MNEDCERLYFEVLERAIRFWSHVEDSCIQASLPNKRKTAQEAIAGTLVKRLKQIIETLIKVYKTEIEEDALIQLLHQGLQELATLHFAPLSAIPRPCEPIELVSYIRQALSSYPEQKTSFQTFPHVFATEILGDQAHSRFDQAGESDFSLASKLRLLASTDIDEFKDTIVNLLSEQHPGVVTSSSNTVGGDNQDKAIGFISLPRIDLNNPLRWPSLIHEYSHFLELAVPEKMWAEFEQQEGAQIASETLKEMEAYLHKRGLSQNEASVELNYWLVECWCDASVAQVTGAPAFFSQTHAFLFSTPCYLTQPIRGKGHPPAWFRLRLMRALILTRHSQASPTDNLINKMIAKEWNTLERLFPPPREDDIRFENALRNIFSYIFDFLVKQFPQEKWLSQSKITQGNLEDLLSDLENGLPIPTHKAFENGSQKKASHAEILLAGWNYRNNELKKELIEIVEKENFQIDLEKQKFIGLTKRAEAALKMSIQVSEWFGILSKPTTEQTVNDDDKGIINNIPGLLVDHEIVKLLEKNSLRIIPLISGINGIEGTSVDIRLGHNFEIFFTNVSGTIDALDRNKQDRVDSMQVDFDSLEGLEITPGQFVLGHTLEYLKLPKNVAVSINGRSGFARQGITVHQTAPFVDAGFDGCLTLEISNVGHSTVKLYPGMRIAQLRFYRCTSSPRVSYSDKLGVKYRGQLRHNKTKQFNDWEIDAFHSEQKRRKSK